MLHSKFELCELVDLTGQRCHNVFKLFSPVFYVDKNNSWIQISGMNFTSNSWVPAHIFNMPSKYILSQSYIPVNCFVQIFAEMDHKGSNTAELNSILPFSDIYRFSWGFLV